jgi:hypothetical protein
VVRPFTFSLPAIVTMVTGQRRQLARQRRHPIATLSIETQPEEPMAQIKPWNNRVTLTRFNLLEQ